MEKEDIPNGRAGRIRLWPVYLIAIGLIFVLFLVALNNRYYIKDDYVYDKWTGKFRNDDVEPVKSDNITKLYNALRSEGYEDLGDESSFREKLKDASIQKKAYEVLKESGYSDIGDFNTFSSKLGYAQKKYIDGDKHGSVGVGEIVVLLILMIAPIAFSGGVIYVHKLIRKTHKPYPKWYLYLVSFSIAFSFGLILPQLVWPTSNAVERALLFGIIYLVIIKWRVVFPKSTKK